jgi:ribosomal protein L25 (general stress protein Ctc)
MEFSTDTEKFLLNSRESYYKFQKHQTNAYACIYGAGEESAKLQFRHLELINPLGNKHESAKIKEYLKWIGPIKSKEHKAFSIKV